jgi:hypothetical protein
MLSRLEERAVPNGYIAAGAGAGAPPLVAIRVDKVNAANPTVPDPNNPGNLIPNPVTDGITDFTSQIFYAYDPRFTGGVHVATGNFDGDYTTPDWLVTGAGAGGGPHVIVWKTAQDSSGNITVTGKAAEFYAFDPRFTGGVNVACGDLDGDGKAELIVSAGEGGGPHVKVYKFGTDGQFHLATEFYAFARNFTGGVSIASGQGYETPFEVRQVFSQQLPNGFAITTPYNPASSRPGLNLTNPSLDFPLFGGTVVQDTQDPLHPFPGPSNTLDSNGFPLPYFDVASGVIQYDSGNLLNSFGNYAYTPNVQGLPPSLDPNYPNDPPINQPLVLASWSASSSNPPDFAYVPSVNYGPFVETSPGVGNGPPQITRLVAPGGQVFSRNQLVLGAGPGGGPHVKVLDLVSDGTQYGLRVNDTVEFYAFDKNYTGGVNVAIGSFVDLPTPGGTITLNGHTYPAITPDLTTPLLAAQQFPYSTENYNQFQSQLMITQMHGGQAAVWSDYNPAHLRRTSISQLNLVPAFLSTHLVFNPNSPLTGFFTPENTDTFPNAIDPQYTGNILSTVSGLTFNGNGATARAQAVFAAGGGSSGPSRGPLIKIFDRIGPSGVITANGNNPQNDPLDQFYAFTSGLYPNGLGGVAFGFGILPTPTRDVIELAPISIPAVTDPQLS